MPVAVVPQAFLHRVEVSQTISSALKLDAARHRATAQRAQAILGEEQLGTGRAGACMAARLNQDTGLSRPADHALLASRVGLCSRCQGHMSCSTRAAHSRGITSSSFIPCYC